VTSSQTIKGAVKLVFVFAFSALDSVPNVLNG